MKIGLGNECSECHTFPNHLRMIVHVRLRATVTCKQVHAEIRYCRTGNFCGQQILSVLWLWPDSEIKICGIYFAHQLFNTWQTASTSILKYFETVGYSAQLFMCLHLVVCREFHLMHKQVNQTVVRICGFTSICENKNPKIFV